jgi:hypothetical protein
MLPCEWHAMCHSQKQVWYGFSRGVNGGSDRGFAGAPKVAKQKVTKLLAQSVPLKLEVEGVTPLEIKLAWNMYAAMTIESRLGEMGVRINILQDLKSYWTEMDCNRLAVGIWSCSQQDNPEYANEEGFEIISSYLTPDNYAAGMLALKEAFLQSLSETRRAAIRDLENKPDPTPAPSQL